MAIEKLNTEILKENINLSEYVGKYVDLRYHGKNYVGLCPFHKEDTPSFIVNTDEKYCHCFGCGISCDIIGFVQSYHSMTFNEAIKHLSEYSGITPTSRLVPLVLDTINSFTEKENKGTPLKQRILKDTCLDGLTFDPIKEWTEEGISKEVLLTHKVGYDKVSNTIAFPIYDNDGNIISLKHRTLDKDYKIKKMPKYVYTMKIGTLTSFYWFFQNLKHIKELEEMIIVESEKSVMKLETWGIFNAVASMTSDLSEEQISLLIKTSGVKNIVVAFDKDKKINKIKQVFRPLRAYKNIYIVRDYDDEEALLEAKDSPCDKGLAVWKELYETRERIKKWSKF